MESRLGDWANGDGAEGGRLDLCAVKVQVALRRRWPALAAVTRPVCARPIGVLCRRAQLEEAQLADLHARPQIDGQRRGVRQFQRDVALEPRVDEPGSGVREKAKSSERGLSLEPGGNVIGQCHRLIRRPEDELAGVKHEGVSGLDLDQTGEVRLLDGGVDRGDRNSRGLLRQRPRRDLRRATQEPMRETRRPFRTADEFELATLSRVHWFNEDQLHSSTG